MGARSEVGRRTPSAGTVVTSLALIAAIATVRCLECWLNQWPFAISLVAAAALAFVTASPWHLRYRLVMLLAVLGATLSLTAFLMLDPQQMWRGQIPSAVGHVLSQSSIQSPVRINPNTYAFLSVPAALSMATLATHTQTRSIVRWILCVVAVGIAIAVVATGSRGGQLAMASGAAVLLISLAPRRWRLLLGTLITCAVAALVPAVLGNGRDYGLQSRLAIWALAVGYARTWTSALLGSGPGVFASSQPPPVLETTTVGNAHSVVLQLFVDLGLLGVGVGTILLLNSLRAARQLDSNCVLPRAECRTILRLYAVCLAALAVNGLFESVLLTTVDTGHGYIELLVPVPVMILALPLDPAWWTNRARPRSA